MSDEPITRENLLSALKYGKLHKDKRLSSAWYVEKIKRDHVSFQLTANDEQRIRQYGDYLGKKGLDDLVAAVRNNYRSDTPNNPSSASSDDFPLSFLREIPFKGGAAQRLDTLMKAAGYNGPTSMNVLEVTNNETNPNQFIIGTRPDLSDKNSQPLLPAETFNFPGGENTTRVYILSDSDGKIDVTYRPASTSSSQKEEVSPPKPIQQLLVSTKEISSPEKEFPYGIGLTLQTNVEISPAHIKIECDDAVGDFLVDPATPGFHQVSIQRRINPPNIAEFFLYSPPFAPQTPLFVRLFSARPIKCKVMLLL